MVWCGSKTSECTAQSCVSDLHCPTPLPQANHDSLQLVAAPGKATALQLPAEPQLPDDADALGPAALPVGVLQLLADASGKPQLAEPDTVHSALLASKGRLLVEVVEAVTGKATPKVGASQTATQAHTGWCRQAVSAPDACRCVAA